MGTREQKDQPAKKDQPEINEEPKKDQQQKKPWLPLEQKDKIQLFFSIIGFAAVVWGLVNNANAVRNDTYLKTYAWALDIDKVIADHPDIRPYLASDTPVVHEPRLLDTNRVYATADYMLDVYDAILSNDDYFAQHHNTEELWRRTIKGNFINNRVLQQRFLVNNSSFNKRLREVFYSIDSTKRLHKQ